MHLRRRYLSVLERSERVHHSRTLPSWVKFLYKPIGWLGCGLYDFYLGLPVGPSFFAKTHKKFPKILDPVMDYSHLKWDEMEPVELAPPRKKTTDKGTRNE